MMTARHRSLAAAGALIYAAAAGRPALHALAPDSLRARGDDGTRSEITVGVNVQVSATNATMPHYEVLSCANPLDTRQMLAGVMAFQNGTFRTIVYRSADGGERWTPVLVAHEATGDPTCVFGPDGTAYVEVLEGQPFKVRLYRSKDGGTTWGPGVEQSIVDRPYLTVDDTHGPFHGSLYSLGVASTRSLDSAGTVANGSDPGYMTGPALFVSRNNGETFTGQLRVTMKPQYALGVSNSAVLADGSLVALLGVARDQAAPFNMDRRPARTLTAVRTTPGGTAMREGVRVGDWYIDTARNEGSNVAALALDRSDGPFANRLYAVWPDNRSGRSQVLLSWSDSKGDAWSAPVVVDDDLSPADANQKPDATNVSVAVNQAGVVGVSWADRREHADNLGWRYRFAASYDGGDTFTPSIKVASASNSYVKTAEYPFLTVPGRSAGPRQPLQMRILVSSFFYSSGHTVGMTTDQAGRFHPMWCDNRTGVSQLWTAAVSVNGSALRNGSEQFAGLEDVTHRIETIVDSIRYDVSRNHGELVLRIKNVSPSPIDGPLRVRVLAISSQMGTPALMQADQRTGGVTFAVETLRPDEQSAAQTLSFSVASHHLPVPGHDAVVGQWQFLNMRLKVFAGRPNNP